LSRVRSLRSNPSVMSLDFGGKIRALPGIAVFPEAD
jgi:hypothetical protein